MLLMLADVPNVMHYGLLFEIKDTSFSFDKHWFQTFDALKCPPWVEVAAGERPQHGLLPAPPHPSTLKGEVTRAISFLFRCWGTLAPRLLGAAHAEGVLIGGLHREKLCCATCSALKLLQP